MHCGRAGDDRVQVGCCVRDLGQVPIAAAAGSDFCELRVWPTLMGPRSDLGELLRTLERARTTALIGNAFMPGDLALVGPVADEEAVSRYVSRALDRMRALGMRCLVLTASGSRSGPPGYPRAEAIRQFSEFVARMAEQCEKNDVLLTVEPVRHQQSRILNSLAETADFIRSHGLDGVLITADVFHMLNAGETGADLSSVAELLGHLHVADSNRIAPAPASARVDEILRAAAAAGAPSTWSLECSWFNLNEELPCALGGLRRRATATPTAGRPERE